jgi:hypothetical protein
MPFSPWNLQLEARRSSALSCTETTSPGSYRARVVLTLVVTVISLLLTLVVTVISLLLTLVVTVISLLLHLHVPHSGCDVSLEPQKLFTEPQGSRFKLL